MSLGYYNQPYLVCRECDVVVRQRSVSVGQKLVCPRCGYVLKAPKHNIINRGFALSLSALILAVPANVLPIMTFSKLGVDSADTLLRNVAALYSQGFWWMALLVLFCSVIAPVLESLLICLICWLVKRGYFGRGLVLTLKAQAVVRRWAMLEVYLLGILVAYVKMISSGQIYFGVGMLCFVGMFTVTALNTLLFDTKVIWEMIGRHREQNLYHG